jgi:hypothetical protein
MERSPANSSGDALGHAESPFDYYFYEEPSDVCRGVTIDMAMDVSGEITACKGKEQMILGRTGLESWQESEAIASASSDRPEFQVVGNPTPVPYGGLACTTVALGHTSAADAMKALYDFLGNEVTASICKLRLEKCSITAQVFLESDQLMSECEMKVRLFEGVSSQSVVDEKPQLMAEFRRRSGDLLAFCRVFEDATTYLKVLFDPICTAASSGRAVTSEKNLLPWCVIEDDTPDADNLGPSVDMLTNPLSPTGQAEALLALCAMAQAAAGAVAVCVALERGQDVLADLMASQTLRVAYPAARLASRLAVQGCCSESLTSSLQHAARKGMAEDGTDSLVRTELASVLRCTA